MAVAIKRSPPPSDRPGQPRISSVTLARDEVGPYGVSLTIQGQGFLKGARATLHHISGASVAISTTFVSSHELMGVSEELAVLPTGRYDRLVVRNPPGGSDTWTGSLVLEPPRAARPMLIRVEPPRIAAYADPVEFVIHGDNLLPKVTVQLTPWAQQGRKPVLVQESFQSTGGKEVHVSLARERLSAGQWRVSVVNPGAGSATLLTPLDVAGQAP